MSQTLRHKGGAAVFTTAAACFSLTGFAAACGNGGNNNDHDHSQDTGYKSSYRWNDYSRDNQWSYDHHKHGDNKYGNQYAGKHDNHSYDNQRGDDHAEYAGYDNSDHSNRNDWNDNNNDWQGNYWNNGSGGNQDWTNGGDMYASRSYRSESTTQQTNETHVNVSNDVHQTATTGDAMSNDSRGSGDVTTGNASNTADTETLASVDNTGSNSGDNQSGDWSGDQSGGQGNNDWQGGDHQGNNWGTSDHQDNNSRSYGREDDSGSCDHGSGYGSQDNSYGDNNGGSYGDSRGEGDTYSRDTYSRDTSATTTNTTNVTVNNNITQTASSGMATSQDNRWGGTVTTGDAANIARTVTYVVVNN